MTVVLLAKRALPRSLGDVPPPEVATALALLPSAFGQLGLAAGETNLNIIKALTGQPGLYRLRVGDWRAVFVRTAQGFLVAAIGLRKDIYERVARMRIGRKGEGAADRRTPTGSVPAPGYGQPGPGVADKRRYLPVARRLAPRSAGSLVAAIKDVGDVVDLVRVVGRVAARGPQVRVPETALCLGPCPSPQSGAQTGNRSMTESYSRWASVMASLE